MIDTEQLAQKLNENKKKYQEINQYLEQQAKDIRVMKRELQKLKDDGGSETEATA